MAVVTGIENIQRIQHGVLLRGIEMYLNHGMKYSRMFTPKNMMLSVGMLTGKTYKRGQLRLAGQDLANLLGEPFNA